MKKGETNYSPGYMLAYRNKGGAILPVRVPELKEKRWKDRRIAEAYCDGVNDYRRNAAASAGTYIVTEVPA